MTITYVIPGARTLDQLNEPTFDGQADENKNDNCVPTSVAEGLNILLAGQTFVGDELKDAVYGQGWTGFQATRDYIHYCALRGVALASFGASQAGLVAAIHQQVSQGHPVVVTMPSQWGTAPADPVHPSGTTHVGLAVGIGPDTIRVMNPWHGFMQDATDEWWQARLCEGEVWIMQKAAAATGGVSVSTAQAAGQPTPFYGLVTTSDPAVWHCPSTGHDVSHGFQTFYAGLRGPNGEGPTQLVGLPISDEYKTPDGKTRQDYERCSFIYDGAASDPWRFYFAPLGQEAAALREQVSALTTQAAQDAAQAKQQAALDAQTIAQQQARIIELESQLAQAPAPTPAPTTTPPASTASATPAPTAAVTPEAIASAAGQAFTAAFAAALAASVALAGSSDASATLMVSATAATQSSDAAPSAVVTSAG